ncbi:hypothetical protein V6N13_042494 [Hibiscus sabdariffa]|uniref:Uncharacterized protein n=1 Tax=Hibiscus sabdariffa TaxID=183260 RepID=A0ABR2G4P5_9ROSI
MCNLAIEPHLLLSLGTTTDNGYRVGSRRQKYEDEENCSQVHDAYLKLLVMLMDKCEKWIRDDDNGSEVSKATGWLQNTL